jgi:DNA-binding response OmpR family regulator
MGKLILVAQENSEAKKTLFTALEPLYSQGFMILSCMSGDEVFKKLSLGTPSLVILDLTLPEMDGFQVINRLRSNIQTANIPIMVVCSPQQGITKLITKSFGVEAYINRPFGPKKLLETVKVCLGEGR